MTHSDTELSDKIALIMGQTDYSAEEAAAKLINKDYDEIEVIREYLRLGTASACAAASTTTTTTTTSDHIGDNQMYSKNQLIYTEIRKFMDGCVRADPDKATSADDNTNTTTY